MTNGFGLAEAGTDGFNASTGGPAACSPHAAGPNPRHGVRQVAGWVRITFRKPEQESVVCHAAE
jgi:hypothetical protein